MVENMVRRGAPAARYRVKGKRCAAERFAAIGIRLEGRDY